MGIGDTGALPADGRQDLPLAQGPGPGLPDRGYPKEYRRAHGWDIEALHGNHLDRHEGINFNFFLEGAEIDTAIQALDNQIRVKYGPAAGTEPHRQKIIAAVYREQTHASVLRNRHHRSDDNRYDTVRGIARTALNLPDDTIDPFYGS